jgi:hypothetical protein
VPSAAGRTATLHRPFAAPREVRLPAELTLDVDEVAVVVVD